MAHLTAPSTNSRDRAQAQQRRRVLEVAKEVSATLGTDFFHSVVRHLAAALHADSVMLGELAAPPVDRIRTLAVFRNGQEVENLEINLSGSAAGQVMSDGVFACGHDARRLFPLDPIIEADRVEAFAGVRLLDAAGQPIGLLASAFHSRLPDVALVKSVLETFTPRSAAELERKRTDDVRRQEEERYRAFVSSNPDAMWRIEFEEPIPLDLPEKEQIERIYRFGYLAECNQAVASLFEPGSILPKLPGARFGEFVLRKDERLSEELREMVRSRFAGITVETSPLDENGHPLHRLRSQFGIVQDGQLLRIWGTTRDITELRRAERSLAASEQRFREVLESVQVPAVMLDRDGRVTFCNGCFLRLAERSREEVSGLVWLDGIISAEECKTWKAALIPDRHGRRASFHFEGTIQRRGGRPHTIAWDTVCLLDNNEDLAGIAALGRDVTRERALEAEIRQTQKLESIGRLASGLAHDFNNLLMVILGQADQLRQEISESSRHYARVEAIENAATQCTDLTAQLRTIGQRQEFQPKLVYLNELISADEHMLRGLVGSGVELVFEFASSTDPVYTDPAQIRRAVVNLVKNAAEAMPEGGRVTIQTANVEIRDEDRDEEDTGVRPGRYVRLCIVDTGTGLSDEAMAHLFEPFFTTKAPGKGTGLGLSTTYAIVTKSAGHIAVRGGPGEGTTVEILLPADRSTIH